MASRKQSAKTSKNGCGCSFPMLLLLLGGSYGWFIHLGQPLPTLAEVQQGWADLQAWIQPLTGMTMPPEQTEPIAVPSAMQAPAIAPSPQPTPITQPASTSSPKLASQPSKPPSPWEKKQIRGIYISRYQITNNASEATIRERVRYYKSQGFNTIIHGVWGNGCTMYRSSVMQQKVGMASCPNLFQDQWLDWMLDEAHRQGMEVHAYFEKGIKLDKNSPIFQQAIQKKWFVPGVDKTYAQIDHYVLNVDVPEVSQFLRAIATEFVQRYPTIDAVQWDDYVGYHAELTTDASTLNEQRTESLTRFMRELIQGVKKANPKVSVDICHHNPYWSKRYFAADWANWNLDRAFIQIYNDGNFEAEMPYVHQYDGAAITDKQLHRLQPLIADGKVKSILVFPSSGQPETSAAKVKQLITR